MKFTVYVRYYDEGGHHIWTSQYYTTNNYFDAVRYANHKAGRNEQMMWSIHNRNHPNHLSNGGIGRAYDVPLLATNVSIRDEGGRFVSWRSI